MTEAWEAVEQHLPFIKVVVGRERGFWQHTMTYEEAVSFAVEATMRLFPGYDPEKGAFTTWVSLRLRGVFHDEWDKQNRRAEKAVWGPLVVSEQDEVLFACPHAPSPDDLLRDVDLGRALALLTTRERHVVQAYYMDGRTQLDISGDLHLTETRVGQIRVQALNKMRRRLLAA